MTLTLTLVGCRALNPTAPAPSPSSTLVGTPLESAVADEPPWLDRAQALEHEGDFYAVPEPLPSGQRGELIRLQRTEPNPTYRLYRMLYHSRTVADIDLAVSGTLWLPVAGPPPGGYPIVSFGAGTHNHFSDACPYSNFDAWSPDEYVDLIERLLAKGYVVAYPDYEGLGTRFPYPYAVGESMTHVLLDAARAALDLLGPDASDRVFLIGHSVGAFGVLAATKFGPTYDDGLDVRGVVSIDGHTDHHVTVRDGMTQPGSSLLLFGILGYSRAFPELRLNDVLTSNVIGELDYFDTTPCNTDPPWEEVPPPEVIHTSPLERADWTARIEEGTPRAASYPVFYPVADGQEGLEALLDMAARVGAEVLHFPPPIDHYSVIDAATEDLLAWMSELH